MNKEEKIKYANNEIIEHGNVDAISEIFSTNYIVHAGDKYYEGHDFIKRWTKQLRLAISDIRIVKVDFYIQTSDTIVWQRTMRGIHSAEMWGIRPTGQKVEWKEMAVSRFNDEKIVEEWVVSELVGELLSKPPIT